MEAVSLDIQGLVELKNNWETTVMVEQKKVPSIRFKGFADDWEQRKLYEIAEFNPKANLPETFQYVDLESVVGTEMISHRTETKESAPSRAQRLARKGDIFFQTVRPYQRNNYLFSKPDKNYVFSTGYAQIRPRIDATFLMSFMQTYDFVKHVLDNCTGTSFPAINSNVLSNLEIALPSSTEEQKKIGKTISNIDSLIILYQSKYNKLLNVKKAMLEKLFPKEGETIPKIRFKGFTGSWAWHKVTELGEIYIGLVTTMTSHYTDHGALLIRNSDIKDGYFDFGINPIFLDDDFAKQNSLRKHRIGDVITVHTGDIGTSAVVTEKEAGSLGFATIVTRPNNNIITSYYLCTYLNTDTHKNFAMNISTGDGRNNYNLKDYYQCMIPVPSIKEQERISVYIQNINNLITLHQRKVEKLKNMKTAMLEKMFVQ